MCLFSLPCQNLGTGTCSCCEEQKSGCDKLKYYQILASSSRMLHTIQCFSPEWRVKGPKSGGNVGLKPYVVCHLPSYLNILMMLSICRIGKMTMLSETLLLSFDKCGNVAQFI
jgi:hypothetical protein